jgi:hypothetical protein
VPFSNRGDVVAGRAQRPDNGDISTFVRKESHRRGSSALCPGGLKDDVLVGQCVCGKLNRGLDIGSGEPGVGVE